MTKKKKGVLIIDDSTLTQEILSDIVKSSSLFELIGVASDPFEAKEMIVKRKPDIITLDVQMPRMGGLEFLERLMKTYPIPVIMISSLTKENSTISLKALSLGAVDVIAKPNHTTLQDIESILLEKLAIAAAVSPQWLNHFKQGPLTLEKRPALPTQQKSKIQKQVTSSSPPKNGATPAQKKHSIGVVAIGASTGGTVAIEYILGKLDVLKMPPIVIVQHIPPVFSRSFAERLDSLLDLNIYEVTTKTLLRPGDVAIAEGDSHLIIEKMRGGIAVAPKEGPLVNHHRPSVDILFNSVANVLPGQALGIILTGMGSDGAKGLLKVFKTDSFTIAQTSATCAVAGMPQSARDLKAVDLSGSLDDIADYLNTLFEDTM
ncbi:chemotaxis-specific protein-glutamate methyltransferase CheB [bacterium]|nr:chemotaxis-specific protein-glutamate methyltransferase CheB [bacterium]